MEIGVSCMPATACTSHAGALRILMCDGLRTDNLLPAGMALSQPLQLESTATQVTQDDDAATAITAHNIILPASLSEST